MKLCLEPRRMSGRLKHTGRSALRLPSVVRGSASLSNPMPRLFDTRCMSAMASLSRAGVNGVNAFVLICACRVRKTTYSPWCG